MPKSKTIAFATTIVAIIVCAILGVTLNIRISEKEDETKIEANIEYAENKQPANITVGEQLIEGVETGQGAIGDEVEVDSVDGVEIPTIEAVEANGPVVEENVECPEGEECGRGAVYPNLDISSPQAFANQVLGKCIDVDGYYGAQCWDLMAAFWYNYTGRTLSTCGTGAAKGAIADGCWQINAGSEFTMIWDKTQIQDGDIAFYSTGTWGHTGMAMGSYNNGYFTLLGQNQGGGWCNGGGASANIINLSTRDFIGAFRPNIYIKPEPQPEPEPMPEGEVTYTYVKGDYFSKVLVALGLDEGKLWEEDGTVKYYTQQLVEQNVLDWRGNVLIGVPFVLTRK